MMQRPLPVPTPETEAFWQACKRHEFIYRHCRRCDKAFHFPRSTCPFCWHDDLEWRTSSGRGYIYAFAIHHRRRPWLEAPYTTVMVSMAEGFRVLTLLEGVRPDPDLVKVGMPVELFYEDINDEITMFKARPSAEAETALAGATGAQEAGGRG